MTASPPGSSDTVGWRALLGGRSPLKAMLRVLLGVTLVVLVLQHVGIEALEKLANPKVAPLLVAGAALQLSLRICRVKKWSLMIAKADLVPLPTSMLYRVQLLGTALNLLLPVSEALKIKSVSATRQQAITATSSIVLDIAVATLWIGIAGLIGAAITSTSSPLIWGLSLTGVLAPVALIAIIQRTERLAAQDVIVDSPAVLCWALIETGCQIGVYALGMRAVGIDVSAGLLLALAPLLFLSDIAVITPSGLGVREGLYAAALGGLTDNAASAGVAAGLAISLMLTLASLVAGVIGLLIPVKAARSNS